MAAGHETDTVNAALMGPIAFSPSPPGKALALPDFSGERGRSPRILPVLRVGAVPMMTVVTLVSARLVRLGVVAAAVVATVVTLAMAAPAIA